MNLNFIAVTDKQIIMEAYVFTLRKMYILVEGLIWNYRISNVSGLKLIFIIENFFLEHSLDHQILQLKFYRLLKIQSALHSTAI